MAFWLIACKEINGKIYVTRLHKATNDHTPGIPDQWHYIGPGTRPFIQNMDGNKFVVVFDYLSHLTARVFDVSVWPPTQVDPIQTVPVIAIGTGTPPQGPEDALFIRYASTIGSANVSSYLPPPTITKGNLIVNGNQYSITLTIANGWVSTIPDPNYFRVYRQPLAGGNWVLVQDWVAAPLNFTDTVTGSIQFKYRATLGAGYHPDYPNDPFLHLESAPGNTLTVDSATQPLDYQLNPVELVPFSSNAYQSTANANFGFRQQYLIEAFFDSLSFKAVGEESSQSVYFADVTRKDTVICTLDPTNYTPPEDTVSFKLVQSGQTSSAVATSARQDQ